MRSYLIWIIVAFLPLVPSRAVPIDWGSGGLDVSLTSEVYYQDIGGNEDKSTLEEGWLYAENVILDLHQGIAEKAQLQGYAHVRGSNDPQYQIDRRDTMFMEGYVRLADNLSLPTIYEIWGGDYAESYTPYTLSTSLLGAKAFYKYNDWFKVSTLWGRNRDEDLDHYIRNTTGGRAEFYYKNYVTIGGTFIHTDVAQDSLRDDSSVGDQFNQVFGGDLHLNLWEDKLHFMAEYARSIYNDDERDKTLRKKYDNAIIVKGDIRPLSNLTVSAEFERVEPWFYSVLGAASADLQRVKTQVDYTPWEMLTTMLMHEYSFNKLNDHSLEQQRTHTHMTSFSSTINPFSKREDVWNSLTVNLQVDHTRAYTTDDPRTTDQDDLTAYCTISQSINQWNYSLGYTYSRNWNRADETSEYFSHSPAVGFGVTYPWLALNWTWDFKGTYEYREYTLSDLVDRIYRGEGTLSLAYERTKSNLNLNMGIEYNDNSYGSLTIDNIRRTASITFDQVLLGKEAFNASLTLRWSYTDCDEETYDEDYTESVYYIGLTVKF